VISRRPRRKRGKNRSRDCRFAVPITAQLSARSHRAVHLLPLSEINRFRLGLFRATVTRDYISFFPADMNFDTERDIRRARYSALEARVTLASRVRRVSAIRMAAASIKGDSCGRHFIEISSEATRRRQREEHCEPLGPSLPSSKPRGLPYIKVLFGSPFRYPYRDPHFWTRRSSSVPLSLCSFSFSISLSPSFPR